MKHPILIIIGLFILIGLSYGPLKKSASDRDFYLNRNAQSSIGGTTRAPAGNPAYSPNQDIAQSIREAERQAAQLEKDIDKALAASRRSPYYGKVRLSNISGLKNSNPDKQYISLYTNLKAGETVRITGWYLRSELTGYQTVIGQAALLPFPFTQSLSDIVLQQGDRAYLTKGFSPIGISFRTNKCTGYFEENRTFTPSLSMQCPLPRNERLPLFSNILDRNEECLDIIRRLPRCRTVGNEFVRDLPDTVPSSCKTYMTTQINYNVCVANHLGDTDFPGNEYRVFFNKFGPLWRESHDTIHLYDENNLIVATISY